MVSLDIGDPFTSTEISLLVLHIYVLLKLEHCSDLPDAGLGDNAIIPVFRKYCLVKCRLGKSIGKIVKLTEVTN